MRDALDNIQLYRGWEEERVWFIVVFHVSRILIFYFCVIFVIRFNFFVIYEMFIEYH